MFGRLVNSLRYRLQNELRSWHNTNSTLRETAWPWYKTALIRAAQHPMVLPSELLSVVLFLSAVIWGYHALSIFLSADPVAALPSQNDLFAALWTVQASIAAMIYPIVIGFVTLLLQRRHSAKASLQIYLQDSAAILTGLGALFLVAAMGVQFFFLSAVDREVVAYWLLLDGIWFIANTAGVIWFLLRTFDYLQPERRARIMRAYAVNFVWPAEVKRNLEYNLFCGAIHYGWLPGPSYSDENVKSEPAVLLGPFGRSMGVINVSPGKRKQVVISNVLFRPLSLAIRIWQWRTETFSPYLEEGQEQPSWLRDSKLLILPSTPGIPTRKGSWDLSCSRGLWVTLVGAVVGPKVICAFSCRKRASAYDYQRYSDRPNRRGACLDAGR